jgi:hypothetical protein
VANLLSTTYIVGFVFCFCLLAVAFYVLGLAWSRGYHRGKHEWVNRITRECSNLEKDVK